MALLKGKQSEIPQDAIILTEPEALSYQTKILRNWKDSADIFAFKYGCGFLVGGSVLSGLYINNYFRTKFKLLHYGRASSYLPICAVPAAFTFLLHTELVLKDLVLQKHATCPICLELRASAIQSMFGLVFPLVAAPLTSLLLTNKYATTTTPSLLNQPRELLKLLRIKVKPIQNILFGIFLGQALLGSVVTYFEAKSVYNVNAKLAKLEYDLEHQRG